MEAEALAEVLAAFANEEDEQADAYGTDDQWWSSLVDDTIAEENEDDSDQEDLEPEDQAKIWDTDTTNPFGAGAADEATKAAPVGNAAAAGQSSVQPRSVQSGSSLHSATVPAGPSPAAAQPAAPLASTTSLPAQHVAVAPSVSGGAGAGPVGMRARLDSRKLAKAPRTTTSRFQASLRHSIRHLGSKDELVAMNLPGIEQEQVRGVAKVLEVLGRAEKTERSQHGRRPSWLDQFNSDEGQSHSETAAVNSEQQAKAADSSNKFLTTLKASLRVRRGTASKPRSSPLSASSAAHSEIDVLSASLKELEAAQEDLAALNMPAASAPPPKPVITISSQPEDEEASQLQRKRSQVISRTRSNQPPATSSDPSPDVPPSAMLAGGQHGKKAEALSLFHAVAQLEAAEEKQSLKHRRLGYSVKHGKISNKSAEVASKWASKELQKLLDVIRQHGRKGRGGFEELTFGALYEKTIDLFDAADVESVLDTARSLGLLYYQGVFLSPRHNFNTVITLLTHTVPQETADIYSYRDLQRLSTKRPGLSKTSKGDEQDSLAFADRNLSYSVKRGQMSKKEAKAAALWVTNEIKKIVDVIVREGRKDHLGRYQCTFSVIYEKTLDILQATEVDSVLYTARNQSIVSYRGEALNPRTDGLVIITLLSDNVEVMDESNYTFADVQRMSVRGNKRRW